MPGHSQGGAPDRDDHAYADVGVAARTDLSEPTRAGRHGKGQRVPRKRCHVGNSSTRSLLISRGTSRKASMVNVEAVVPLNR